MKFKEKKLWFLLLVAIFLFSSSSAWARTFDRIVAFGDSLSDHGGLAMWNGTYAYGTIAAPPSWTNDGATPYGGDVWLDYLATSMGAVLEDYAIGGAMTLGHENDMIQHLSADGYIPPLGLIGQVDSFGAIPPPDAYNTLVTIWFGGNDFIQFISGTYYDYSGGYPGTLVTNPITLVTTGNARIQTAMTTLYSGGARNFLVVNLPDLSKAPAFNTLDAGTRGQIQFLVQYWNSTLASNLASFSAAHPDATVYTFDAYTFLNQAISAPAFPDVTDPWLSVDGSCSWTGGTNGTYTDFLFFDCIHPMSAAHEMLADSLSFPTVTVLPGFPVGDTINEALDTAETGDTIRVPSGTYNENLTVNKSITLESTDGATTTEIAGGGGIGITVSASNVAIDGFKITNPSGTVGVYAASVSNLLFQNNLFGEIGTLTHGNIRGLTINGNNGNVSNVNILNNTFDTIGNNDSSASNGSSMAIYLGDSGGGYSFGTVTIKGNTITNIQADYADAWHSGGYGAYGIGVNYGSNNSHSVSNLQITDNKIDTLHGLWAHAIGMETNTPNAIVTGNKISNVLDSKTPSDAVGVWFEANPTADTVTVSDNNFENVYWGVAQEAGDQLPLGLTVAATNNWWGRDDGPSAGTGAQASTATGSGVAVCTQVTYNPWLVKPSGGYHYLAADFGSSGAWLFDGISSWAQYTTSDVGAAAYYFDGTTEKAYAADPTGLWTYGFGTAPPVNLGTAVPENMIAFKSVLLIDYGATYGLWKWDGTTGTQLDTADPGAMCAVGPYALIDLAGKGLYQYDGTSLTFLGTAHPENIIKYGSVALLDYGTAYGLWKWNGTTGMKLDTSDAGAMCAVGSYALIDFAGNGLYQYNGSSFTFLGTAHPENIVALSGTVALLDYGTAYGLWKWDGTTGTQIGTADPAKMVQVNSQVYLDYAGYGLYKYDGTTATQIAKPSGVTTVAEQMLDVGMN